MKRIKLKSTEVSQPTPYQSAQGERERMAIEESFNDTLSARMLENLKMALFFSRVQSQMNREMPDM